VVVAITVVKVGRMSFRLGGRGIIGFCVISVGICSASVASDLLLDQVDW